jgi:hypothetical protein
MISNYLTLQFTAIAGGSDAYEVAGSQGRMTEERWWASFGCTARFVAEPL